MNFGNALHTPLYGTKTPTPEQKGMLLGFHYPPKFFSWPTQEIKHKLK